MRIRPGQKELRKQTPPRLGQPRVRRLQDIGAGGLRGKQRCKEAARPLEQINGIQLRYRMDGCMSRTRRQLTPVPPGYNGITDECIRENATSRIIWHGLNAEALEMEKAKEYLAEGQ